MVKKYHYNNIHKNYTVLKEKNVIIWCRSIYALNVYRNFYNSDIKVIGFTDSFVNEEGTKFAGLPVYSFKEILEMNDVAVYIATQNSKSLKAILEKLENAKHIDVYAEGLVFGPGLYNTDFMSSIVQKEEEKIQAVKERLADMRSVEVFGKLLEYRLTNNEILLDECFETKHSQYFPVNEIMQRNSDEIFVDAGAYNGMTSLEFKEWVYGKYSEIYLMEPDPLMYEIMKETVNLYKIGNVVTVNAGAYSFNGELQFYEDSVTGSSRIDNNGTKVVKVITIDEMLRGNKATFIKMDIEGAELAALEGAKKTIEKYKPKLAISIYHREDDLWEIPYYIMKNYPWYKIYIRHYTNITTETVMYAVADENNGKELE